MTDRQWEQRDREAWEAAAADLDTQAYKREADGYWPAVFTRTDCPDLVLVRDLGRLNWHPRNN